MRNAHAKVVIESLGPVKPIEKKKKKRKGEAHPRWSLRGKVRKDDPLDRIKKQGLRQLPCVLKK